MAPKNTPARESSLTMKANFNFKKEFTLQKNFSLIAIIYLIFLVFFNPGGECKRNNDFRIRILIRKHLKSARFKGKYLTVKDLFTFKDIIKNKKEITIKIRKGKILINGKPYIRLKGLIIISSNNISFNSMKLSGRIEVINENYGLLVINDLNLEEYLVGVVSKEMNPSWSLEALKAQAVAARTYAVRKILSSRKKFYDLETTIKDQVYKGVVRGNERVRNAVFKTKGEILTYKGQIAEIYFHSTCGGKTASALEVWAKNIPYLKSVKCEYDSESPFYFWKFSIAPAKLRKELIFEGRDPGVIKKITLKGRTKSGRVRKIEIKGSKRKISISGEDLRRILGYSNLKSTLFKIRFLNGKIEFMGSGAGHGVGMCQWGAKGMAEKGYSYREILRHYYPGTKITKYSKWLRKR